MTIPIDTSGDWDLVEGLEDVTFFSATSESAYEASGIVTKGKQMPLSKAQVMAGDIQLSRFGVVWHVWKELLGGRVPKYKDKIVAGGVKYLIQSVDVVSLTNRYRCTCLRSLT